MILILAQFTWLNLEAKYQKCFSIWKRKYALCLKSNYSCSLSMTQIFTPLLSGILEWYVCSVEITAGPKQGKVGKCLDDFWSNVTPWLWNVWKSYTWDILFKAGEDEHLVRAQEVLFKEREAKNLCESFHQSEYYVRALWKL